MLPLSVPRDRLPAIVRRVVSTRDGHAFVTRDQAALLTGLDGSVRSEPTANEEDDIFASAGRRRS